MGATIPLAMSVAIVVLTWSLIRYVEREPEDSGSHPPRIQPRPEHPGVIAAQRILRDARHKGAL